MSGPDVYATVVALSVLYAGEVTDVIVSSSSVAISVTG